MSPTPFLSGRATFERAEALLLEHGDDAATAALGRALAAQACDNAVMYCRWREVERLCALPKQMARGQSLN